MTDRTDADKAALEAMFAQARVRVPLPQDALVDRALAAALAVQPAGPLAGRQGRAADVSVWCQLMNALGGWRGLGGLSSAMALGLVMGFGGTVSLPLAQNAQAVDLMPGADALFADTAEEN